MTVTTWTNVLKQSLSLSKWEQSLSIFITMTKSGIKLADPSLYPSLIKATSKLSFKQAQSVHATAVKLGYDAFVSVQNSLLDLYTKWGGPHMGLAVFESMREVDGVGWNILVGGYLRNGEFDHGLCLFLRGVGVGYAVNVGTLVLVAKGYRVLGGLNEGRMFHGYVVRTGFLGFEPVLNSVLGLYVGCDFGYACKLFDEMSERDDVVGWSLMISGCVQNEVPELGLSLFRDMLGWVNPDGLTMVSVLRACSSLLGGTHMGGSLHGCAVVRGHTGDTFVSNSLIDLYSRCGDPLSALRVFDEMNARNVVSWNSILWGMVHNSMVSEAVWLIRSMVSGNVEADEVTLVNVLQLCKHLLEPMTCRLVHARAVRSGYGSNPTVIGSLVDAYSKCGLIETAWRVFAMTGDRDRDTVTWATMIGGFAHCGMPDHAITIFNQFSIVNGGVNNPVVLLNLLEACAASADMTTCRSAHCIAIRTHLISEVSVGTAVVDMYSKCGAVGLARTTFNLMTNKNLMSWTTMISAYGMNSQPRQALAILREMDRHGLRPNSVTALSVLAACSHGGLVQSGLSFFRSMLQELKIEPNIHHYACLTDMLSRAGRLDIAIDLIKNMPLKLRDMPSIWGAVLSASVRYRETSIGEEAGSKVIEVDPCGSSGYLLCSRLYAGTGAWGDVARMRWMVRESGAHVAGYSSVRVGGKGFRFVAGDRGKIDGVESCYFLVERLHKSMERDVELDDIFE